MAIPPFGIANFFIFRLSPEGELRWEGRTMMALVTWYDNTGTDLAHDHQAFTHQEAFWMGWRTKVNHYQVVHCTGCKNKPWHPVIFPIQNPFSSFEMCFVFRCQRAVMRRQCIGFWREREGGRTSLREDSLMWSYILQLHDPTLLDPQLDCSKSWGLTIRPR